MDCGSLLLCRRLAYTQSGPLLCPHLVNGTGIDSKTKRPAIVYSHIKRISGVTLGKSYTPTAPAGDLRQRILLSIPDISTLGQSTIWPITFEFHWVDGDSTIAGGSLLRGIGTRKGVSYSLCCLAS